jgi:F-type H+-transporting ATPase subunit delta
MENPRLAGRYAKSLIDLATERNQLEEAYNDMKYLEAVCKSSREFVSLLKSPVIPAEKKGAIVTQVTNGKVGDLTAAFNKLLISKNREESLPEIVTAFIDQYNTIKGIHKIKLTSAVEISEDVKSAILNKIKRDTTIQNIELETKIDPSLIGGFVLEYDNNLVDASIKRDLRQVKAQFNENIFVTHIR